MIHKTRKDKCSAEPKINTTTPHPQMPENKVIIVSFDNKMMQESERTHNKTKFHFQMAAFIRTATKLSSLRTLTRLDFGRDFP